MSVLEQLRLVRIGWSDVLEIAVVSFALYRVLLLLHRTRAMQILVGIVVLVLAYAVARLLDLAMILTVLGNLWNFAAIALVVVFAPEIRAMFAQLGRSPVSRFVGHMGPTEVAGQITDAVERLSRAGAGAIVAVQRESPLEEFVQTGSPIHAKVSSDLLCTIFTPNSPLHDGAVIVRGDTIVAAGCILPLSQVSMLDRRMGTRHRAALGLSEDSDAIVVAVSEETSAISVAVGGHLWRSLTAAETRAILSGRVPREVAEPRGVRPAV
jgi:diadenylate cyclase